MGFNKKTVLIALVISLLVLGAGCWGGGGDTPPDDPPDGGAETTEITVYFYNGEGELVPVTREIVLEEDTPENRLRAAVAELSSGGFGEVESDLYNNFPEDAELLDLEISRPYATLNFSAGLEQMGGSTRVFGVLEQLTWTATALDEVSGLILEVEGERVGSGERPFTGEGVLFDTLRRPAAGDWAREASPAKCLESFLVTIGPDTEEMWKWMGPRAREAWETPENVDWTALAEGLGSWRDYEIEEEVEGDVATVTIRGDRVVEGMQEPDAEYPARMVREDGVWKWDLRAD